MKIYRTMTEAAKKANRENAAASTGPTTIEGKARSAQNARKHGILAKSVVFDNPEEEREYQEFFAALEREQKPRDFLERIQLEELAVAYFRRRRAMQLEQRVYGKNNAAEQIMQKVIAGNAMLLGVYDLPEDNQWPCTEMNLVCSKGTVTGALKGVRSGSDSSESQFQMHGKWQDPTDAASRYSKDTESHLARATERYLKLKNRKLS